MVSAHRLPPFLFTKPSISRTEFTQITNRVVSEAFNFTRTSQYYPRYSNHRKLCSCQKLIKKTYVYCTYIMVHVSTVEHLWHRRLLNPWRTGAWTSALLFSAISVHSGGHRLQPSVFSIIYERPSENTAVHY